MLPILLPPRESLQSNTIGKCLEIESYYTACRWTRLNTMIQAKSGLYHGINSSCTLPIFACNQAPSSHRYFIYYNTSITGPTLLRKTSLRSSHYLNSSSRLTMTFGNHNAQDTVSQTSLDVVLINSTWKAERSVEISYRALIDPRSRFRSLGLP